MEPEIWRCDPGLARSEGERAGDGAGPKAEADRLDSAYGSQSLSGRLDSSSCPLGESGDRAGPLGESGDRAGPGPKAEGDRDGTERLDSSYGSQSLSESLTEALDRACRLGEAADELEAEAGLLGPGLGSVSFLNPYSFLGEDGDSIVHLATIHNAGEYALHFISVFTVEMLDIQNDLFQSALHLAVYTNQVNIVRELVLRGASLWQQDWNGNTPLHLACQHQLLDCVRVLTGDTAGKELNMELQNWQGRTCLHVATLTKNQEIIELLLQKGSDINTQDGTSGKSSLHLSVEVRDPVLVQFMLRSGASVDAMMYNGCTALHLAVGRQDTHIADILCQAGADTLLPNVEGDTPQDLANGNVDILALFPFDDIKLMGRPVACSEF